MKRINVLKQIIFYMVAAVNIIIDGGLSSLVLLMFLPRECTAGRRWGEAVLFVIDS